MFSSALHSRESVKVAMNVFDYTKTDFAAKDLRKQHFLNLDPAIYHLTSAPSTPDGRKPQSTKLGQKNNTTGAIFVCLEYFTA